MFAGNFEEGQKFKNTESKEIWMVENLEDGDNYFVNQDNHSVSLILDEELFIEIQ